MTFWGNYEAQVCPKTACSRPLLRAKETFFFSFSFTLCGTFYTFRKQFAEQYLAVKKQLHYHKLWRSKYPNFCDYTIKEPHISLTRRGKLNFLLQAFRKITSNSASCTRKSFFLPSSHAPPLCLPALPPHPPSVPPSLRYPQRQERKMDSGKIRDNSQETPRKFTA